MRSSLTDIGLASLRGVPVDLLEGVIPEEEVVAAASNFLTALDALLASATSEPRGGKHPVLPLEVAAAQYSDAVAWVAGVVVHGDPGDLYAEVVTEIEGARESLRSLAASHWDAATFWATQRAFEQILRPGGLKGRWAYLSFLREERRAA